MFLVNRLTTNDASAIFALQSYNATIGSMDFSDNASGVSDHVSLQTVGTVSHDNIITSSFCNSDTSINFPSYDGHIEGTNIKDTMNFYASNFAITAHYYLTERVHDVVLLGMFVDDNNYWYLRLTNTGCNPTFVYRIGEDLINVSVSGYCDVNRWLYTQVVKSKTAITIMHGKSGTTECKYDHKACPEYLPPLDTNRMRLVIGAWLHADGTHDSNLAIKGAMNSILIKKSTFNNVCHEQGRHRF